MRFRRTLGEPDEPTELNLIPLIDVMIFLVIFFVSTTSFIDEPGIKVDKPTAMSGSKMENTSIIFAVSSDGKIVHGDNEIGLGGVRPTVQRLCAKEPLPVVIQADQRSESGVLIRVIDEAKLGGAKDVSLATKRG